MVSNENLFLYDESRDKVRSFWQNGGEGVSVLFRNEIVKIEKTVYHNDRKEYTVKNDNLWMTVLEGDLELEVAGESLCLSKGESRYIPRGRRFRAGALSEMCLVLSVFF
ncbi:MAG: cupin domain-containing protein [Clostridiales bacterium]|jgi:mannose-6-phosphate isomerase-like protein (cupin superfamily)|nr:cupin domain-containing protein [Clostridiales bacterium]